MLWWPYTVYLCLWVYKSTKRGAIGCYPSTKRIHGLAFSCDDMLRFSVHRLILIQVAAWWCKTCWISSKPVVWPEPSCLELHVVFPTTSKDMQIRVNADSNQPLGVNVTMSGFLSSDRPVQGASCLMVNDRWDWLQDIYSDREIVV